MPLKDWHLLAIALAIWAFVLFPLALYAPWWLRNSGHSGGPASTTIRLTVAECRAMPGVPTLGANGALQSCQLRD